MNVRYDLLKWFEIAHHDSHALHFEYYEHKGKFPTIPHEHDLYTGNVSVKLDHKSLRSTYYEFHIGKMRRCLNF